jgi:hypothetical protein
MQRMFIMASLTNIDSAKKISAKQYKDKFKLWGWRRNLRKQEGLFMKSKALKRQQQNLPKDTVFEWGGQEWTRDRVLRSFGTELQQDSINDYSGSCTLKFRQTSPLIIPRSTYPIWYDLSYPSRPHKLEHSIHTSHFPQLYASRSQSSYQHCEPRLEYSAEMEWTQSSGYTKYYEAGYGPRTAKRLRWRS